MTVFVQAPGMPCALRVVCYAVEFDPIILHALIGQPWAEFYRVWYARTILILPWATAARRVDRHTTGHLVTL